MGLVLTTHTNSHIFKGSAVLQSGCRRNATARSRRYATSWMQASRSALATDNVPVSLFWPIWQRSPALSGTNERVAPEQALTRAEALRCATANGAYLTFDEDKKGSLAPGKLADLAVLSADPLTVEEAGIRDITALMTMVGGRIVHETQHWCG